MHLNFEYVTSLQYENRALRRQVDKFRSGRKYTELRTEYETVCRKKDGEIRKLKTELADARARIVTIRNQWMEVAEDIQKESENQILKEQQRAERAERQICHMETLLSRETEEKSLWRSRYYEQSARVEELEGLVKKLTAQVNRDFHNSSIPSSQQGAGRKKIPNSREKTGRKQGGQEGHEGHRLQQRRPTEIHYLPDPPEYANNPDYYATGATVSRQKIFLVIGCKVVQYTARVFRNRITGSRVHAEFPEGYDTDISYDASVKAAAFLLANEGNMSTGKIQSFLAETTGGAVCPSRGTISNLCREFAQKTIQERETILQDLMTSSVLNTDFTNANVNGNAKQVLIIASPSKKAVMYIGRDHKGHKGVAGTPVADYVGTLVHDHDATFYSYGLFHQECMQHNIRYLIGSEENEPERTWNRKMHQLLQEMLHYKNQLDGEEPDPVTVKAFEERYDVILQTAKKEYEDDPPGDYYREGCNLFRRLEQFRESQLRFLHDKDVPSNNSLAERLARTYKRKQKQAIVLRSDENFRNLCDCMSVIQSCRWQEENLYQKVSEVFSRKKEQV